MSYSSALWDGSDPLYSPDTIRSKGYAYWRPSKRMVEMGYPAYRRRLPGMIGDGRDLERAQMARDLTREMVRWSEDTTPKVTPGTWRHLISSYMSDKDSPYQEVKANTRVDYRHCCNRWLDAISDVVVAETSLSDIKLWRRTMADNGRTASYQKRQFTMLRMIVSYGKSVRFPGAKDVQEVLEEVRVKGGKPRSVAPTAEQVHAIIAAADAGGSHMFALGLSLQWWLTLRAVDVRGQWLPGDAGGIRKHGKYWADGLTWDMIDREVTTLRKTPSKTEDALPEELVYDLTLIPDLRRRLLAIPKDKRVGPVIVQGNGMPYERRRWVTLFARYRAKAGVPEHIWAMDLRAGAINDAKRKGATHIQLQHAAHHTQASTTDRYIRERSDSVNAVIRMRTS